MNNSKTTIQFLDGWRQEQHGVIERGSRITLEYEKGRLPDSFAQWRGAEFGDIVAVCRFHPRGDIKSGSVVAPVRDRENPPGMVIGHVPHALDVAVPPDATRAEIWFHGFYQTTSHHDSWDSRFGENYWFEIQGPPPRMPAQPVMYRAGALTRPDVVNVLEHSAAKIDTLRETGVKLETTLNVVAWVRESPYGANAWIDVHVFNDEDELIEAETLTLSYSGLGPVSRYEFSGTVYHGATATPGSVQFRPDARTIQYRLYYDVNYQVFTDGILHQFELTQDALVRSASVDADVRRETPSDISRPVSSAS